MAALSGACVIAYTLITVGIFGMTKPIEVAKRLLREFLPSGLSRMLGLSAAH